MAELTVESSAVGGRKWRVLSVFFFKKYESLFYFSFHPPVDWVFFPYHLTRFLFPCWKNISELDVTNFNPNFDKSQVLEVVCHLVITTIMMMMVVISTINYPIICNIRSIWLIDFCCWSRRNWSWWPANYLNCNEWRCYWWLTGPTGWVSCLSHRRPFEILGRIYSIVIFPFISNVHVIKSRAPLAKKWELVFEMFYIDVHIHFHINFDRNHYFFRKLE